MRAAKWACKMLPRWTVSDSINYGHEHKKAPSRGCRRLHGPQPILLQKIAEKSAQRSTHETVTGIVGTEFGTEGLTKTNG